ncbi:MAG TPA: hypothetical protein VL501_00905 [Pyrinomonadaceae bacterium]|nr:hypothetical protein [Pyrinomonadaceae bacterium]
MGTHCKEATMVRRLFFVVCLVALTSVVSLAQARRTVTNSDLERYRQTRVTAERELREDYSRLGFPPPEVMLQRDKESQQQLLDLSSRLKSERLERERMELEHQRLIQAMTVPVIPNYGYRDTIQPGDQFWPTVWGDGVGFGGGVFDGRGFRRRFQQDGYFAGGQFWPTGPRTPLRPMMAKPHVTPHVMPHHR